MLNIILAITDDYGIGYKNTIPWKFSNDLIRFYNITTYNKHNVNNTLIMGRLTAESLPKSLPKRNNILLTRQTDYELENFIVKPDLLTALEWSFKTNPKSNIFVIGGAQIIRELLKYPNLINKIYLTKITENYTCDAFVLELCAFLYNQCTIIETIDFSSELIYYTYQHNKSTSSEQNYLDLMLNILRAPERSTRNAVTKSLFSSHLTFDLEDGFPLLTTKKVFWKGIVNELLFFLGGCTDNNWLKERNVHIWDGNTTKEFIEKCNLPYEEGDMGPMYGFMWRYYGAKYQGMKHDYTNQGKDQFAEVIDLLINDPYSRRILMTTYNYDQVKEGVLYPCHGVMCQFYVEDNKINLQMMQRSCDWFLGVCYNIASYALLLEIIVNHLNHRIGSKKYQSGKLYMTFGDYHLYDTHYQQAIQQISRIPRAYPTLLIKENIESIDPKYFLSLTADNFVIENYDSYPGIKANMVA